MSQAVDCRSAFFNAHADLLRAASSTSSLDKEDVPNSDGDVLIEYWRRVENHYGEEWRRYHTLDHITEMLTMSRDICPDHIAASPDLKLAIIFHDVIYVPKQGNNEEESALLFEEFAAATSLQKLKPESCSSVKEMILATKAHCTDCHTSGRPGESELHYMLDLDMAVLGRPAEGYERYSKQIREEYCHVTDADFRNGRRRVLQSFLDLNRIYVTAEFHELLEERARCNIRNEIDTLT